MNRIVTICTALLTIASTFLPQLSSAQAPEKMSYQAVVRNSTDQLVVNTQVGMKISIQKYVLGIPPSYQNVYIETHTPTTNENGLVSLEIGDGTVVGGVFADIDWSNGEYYIKTETDPTGGTSYSIAGTSQLLSVPYALHAKNAKTYKVGDFAYDGIVFWVDESGQHGLVCTKVDLSTNVRWYAGTYIDVPTGSRSGRDNTLLILSLQAPTDDNGGYAAKICINYYYGVNFMGWYLPSMDELHRMYQQRNIINATALANGGTALGNYDYWSSTQFNGAFAFYENLQSGSSGTELKSDGKAVRAVREF